MRDFEADEEVEDVFTGKEDCLEQNPFLLLAVFLKNLTAVISLYHLQPSVPFVFSVMLALVSFQQTQVYNLLMANTIIDDVPFTVPCPSEILHQLDHCEICVERRPRNLISEKIVTWIILNPLVDVVVAFVLWYCLHQYQAKHMHV